MAKQSVADNDAILFSPNIRSILCTTASACDESCLLYDGKDANVSSSNRISHCLFWCHACQSVAALSFPSGRFS